MGDLHHIKNPADLSERVGEIEFATSTEAQGAFDQAQDAFGSWRRVPLSDRLTILGRAADRLEASLETIAKTITRENGKVLREAKSEVRATLADWRLQLEYACTPSSENEESENRVYPLGVFLLITPWNFPLATIARNAIPALAMGNTVVIKASEITPFTALALENILKEAGLPAGVAKVVIGRGEETVPPLLHRPEIRGVSFTGSTLVGRSIQNQIQSPSVRLQLEMGGKNALVVLKDADIDAAVEAAMTAGFTCSGQWCLGTSRLIVEEGVGKDFKHALVSKMKKIKLGSGFDEKSDMGPVCGEGQYRKVMSVIERANVEQVCVIGGESMRSDRLNGYFIPPTLYEEVSPDSFLFQEETFGPVLSMTMAISSDHALELANKSPYGLSFSVYTRDAALAEMFVSEVDAGVCHVNAHTGFRDPALPLGGWKASGLGHPECGQSAQEFYCKRKAIYRKEL